MSSRFFHRCDHEGCTVSVETKVDPYSFDSYTFDDAGNGRSTPQGWTVIRWWEQKTRSEQDRDRSKSVYGTMHEYEVCPTHRAEEIRFMAMGGKPAVAFHVFDIPIKEPK